MWLHSTYKQVHYCVHVCVFNNCTKEKINMAAKIKIKNIMESKKPTKQEVKEKKSICDAKY